ncbi:hypothetical protein F3157_21765 [Virgibacillus dakarensis]|uniref:Uncharacterized protein n=1 Tax=Lentibacillus populi TaxID=1827502 RepID=A0A9W5TUP7_9BACI|nr:hypothetical protein [Lentibacillus populi]MTW88224.1 hypothetical protein [Virgibacillus dakarensis]GGB32146.1 hypothetical protein GCM10011409_06910 [Lentibacillus populi]
MNSQLQDYDIDGALADGEQTGNQAVASHTRKRDTDVEVRETQNGNARDNGGGNLVYQPIHHVNDKKEDRLDKENEERADTVFRNVNDRMISNAPHKANHILDNTVIHNRNDNLNDNPAPLVKQKDIQNKTIQVNPFGKSSLVSNGIEESRMMNNLFIRQLFMGNFKRGFHHKINICRKTFFLIRDFKIGNKNRNSFK